MGNPSTNCGVCDSPTNNGYVCANCQPIICASIQRAGISVDDDRGETVLCVLDELDVQISRQARAAPRMGGRSAETPVPFDSAAAKAHARLADILTTWARHYSAPRDVLAGPRRSAHWLRGNVPDLARRGEGLELLHEALDTAMSRAFAVMDRPDIKDYVGICSTEYRGKTCNVDLYAAHDAAHCVCPHCGTKHNVRLRRLVMMTAARDLLLNGVDSVRIANTYGAHITAGQVYKWKFRGRLLAQGLNGMGESMYRLGDVLELAGRNGLLSEDVEG